MENKYLVRANELAPLPKRFDQMLSEMQSLVLKHTAASFEVIWHHDDWVGHPNFKRVPVIVRYQFKLQRRRAEPFADAPASKGNDRHPAFQK